MWGVRKGGLCVLYDAVVYELSIETTFSAAHAIEIRGVREPVHGHDWRVTAVVEGPNLDQDGLLCDFHDVESKLREIVGPFHNRSLNEVPPFTSRNPSAEHVARHIADELAEELPAGVRVQRVRVTEAVGCAATFIPGR